MNAKKNPNNFFRYSALKFFDEIFGEGTSEKMFNGKKNYQKCLNAFKEIMDIKKKQDEEIDIALEYLEKYSPDRVKRS